MSATQSTPTGSKSRFDKLSFVKYVKDIGRDYREQAIKLVYFCRIFAQAQKQTRSSYEELRSMLQVVDDALHSATEAQKKTTKDADAEFKKATDALSAYGKIYHPEKTVIQTMADAKAKDKSSSTVLKRLKETLLPLKEEPTKIVKFLLHKSLPDENPTVVKQLLSQSSDTKEILWNFSRFKGEKRLTLKDNPHFYDELPTSAEKYEGQFRTDPVETFQQEKISVLTDRPCLTGRLFLETAKKKRAFGNAWVPKEAIIFKDVCGKLEGENIIVSAIENTPNLWCFEEPSLSNTPSPTLPDRSSPSPTTTATPTTSPTGALLGDWRVPILRMLRSEGVEINIRISDKWPTSFSSGYSGPSLPSPLPDSKSIVGSLTPTPQSRPTLGLRIPGTSQGPQSPPYKTARSTPLAERSPAVAPSPRSPAPLFSEPLTFPTPASNVVPSTGPAVELSPALLHVFPEPLIFPAPASNVAPSTGPAVELSPAPLFPEPLIFPTPASNVAPPTGPVVELSLAPLSPKPLILPTPTSNVALTGPAVPDPTVCPLPDTSLREVSRVPVDPIPSQGGTAIIFPQPHIVAPCAQINDFEVPAINFGRGATTNLAISDLASGLIIPPQQKAVVQTPPKPKRHWYQKCFDVIKSTIRPGLS